MPAAVSALDVALRFLGARPRSEAEVRRRLARAGHAPEAIEPVLAQLRKRGLLDDAAFADYWLAQRHQFRPRGQRLLQAELRQHGVAAELASSAAATASDSAAEDAYRAALKRARQLSAAYADERTFRARLGQHLARRGFDWDTITATVERLQRELLSTS
jgi:regulatory protein